MSSATALSKTLEYTTQILSAHVSNNSVQATDLPAMIQDVHKALSSLGAEPEPSSVKPEPAVPVRKSVFPDYIVCLEDGKKLKMLKRHLQTSYGLTPDDYRARWGLPSSYPMVAASYAERRSALAKSIGLGRKPKTAKALAPAEAAPGAGAKPVSKNSRSKTKPAA